jgi:hypothetical protein
MGFAGPAAGLTNRLREPLAGLGHTMQFRSDRVQVKEPAPDS